MDYQRHNSEVEQVWEAYRNGKPTRVPMVLGINPRYTMGNHPANPHLITFEQYMASPETMMQRQLEHQEFVRNNVPFDTEMGPPQAWHVYVDFQNVSEAAWFGCPIVFDEGQVPDTRPILNDDNKNRLFDEGIPDPFSQPTMQKNWEFHEFFKQKEAEGYEHKGIPIKAGGPAAQGTDGPMTVACNVRGASEFCLDLAMDPDYAQTLLEYVTEATIVRLKAYRKALGQPEKAQGYGWADDSVALLSVPMYTQAILPWHRKLLEAFSEGGPNSIHLCGDATRHFPTIQRELNVQSFDTGFPVDFAWLRSELGPEAEILGGPHVALLKDGTPEVVAQETRRILGSGVMEGGRFILREGNNLAPGTPIANIQAMYDTCKMHGVY